MRYSKYRAVPTTVDGIRFASKKEARRYQELKILEQAGHIDHLVLQEHFRIEVNGVHICDYRADFSYLEPGCVAVVEDVKGMITPMFKLKQKLMRAVWGIDIRLS